MTDVMAPPVEMPPFAYRPAPYQGPSREEVLALRRAHVNPAVFTLYREPLMIVDGRMQYLFDETGRRYLASTHWPWRRLMYAITARM